MIGTARLEVKNFASLHKNNHFRRDSSNSVFIGTRDLTVFVQTRAPFSKKILIYSQTTNLSKSSFSSFEAQMCRGSWHQKKTVNNEPD